MDTAIVVLGCLIGGWLGGRVGAWVDRVAAEQREQEEERQQER